MEMVYNDASKSNYAKAARALRQMDAEIGSELNYKRLALADIAERKTIICRCTHENEIPRSDTRVFSCAKCSKEVWLTANTFYHKVRLFRPRIVIIRWFEMGITISANQAKELLAVSNHTVNLIYKQLSIVVRTQMSEDIVEVPSSLCTAIISRRSTETPKGEHPVAEELSFRNQEEVKTKEIALDSKVDEFSLSINERTIFEMLSEKSVSFDRLLSESSFDTPTLSCTVVLLELKGLLQSLPGNQYVRMKQILPQANKKMSHWHESIAKDFTYFIKDFFQGVSRKNLQIYAALYWISFDRARWPVSSLRKLCACHSHISYEEILAYITPAQVKFVPISNMA